MKKILFLVLLLSSITSFASHFAGGDIEYQWIGQRQWKIKLTLYRDCTGCPTCFSNGNIGASLTGGMVAKPNYTLNPPGCFANPSQVNVTMTLVKVEDVMKYVNTVCGNVSKNGCNNLGTVTPGPSTPSIEKWIYEGTLNLNLPTLNASCAAYWDIAYTSNARNSGMSNIGAEDFSIGATINIYNRQGSGKNNSPVITNEPIITVCSAQEFKINMGAVDADGDSLTYELIRAYKSYPNATATYINGFSYYSPFTLNPNKPPHINVAQPNGAYVIVDTFSGDVGFNAINNTPTIIFGDLCLRIRQWAYNVNGVPDLVGETMRDMQYYVRSCPANTPPNLSTIPSLPNGQPKYDYEVCAGEQLCFIVTAKDTDVYPTIPRFDTTYMLWNNAIVRPGKLTFGPNYPTGSGNPRPREEQWQFCWQTELSDARDQPYYFTTTVMDNYCPYVGQFNKAFSIKVRVNAALTDTLMKLACNRYIIQVKKLKTGAASGGVTLQVANKPNDFNYVGGYRTKLATQPNPAFAGDTPAIVIADTFGYMQPGKYLIKYFATPTSGSFCNQSIYYDTLTVDTFTTVSLADTLVCAGTNLNLTLPSGNYTWGISGGSSAIGVGNVLNYVPTSTVGLTYTGVITSGVYQNCSVTDTVFINVKPSPLFSLPDSMLMCGGQKIFNVTNQTQGFSTSYLWNDNDTVSIKNITVPGAFKVTATQSNGCSASDSVNVLATNTLNLIASNDTAICTGGVAKLVASGAQKYQWGYMSSNNFIAIGSLGTSSTMDVSPTSNTRYVVKGYSYAVDTTIKNLSCLQTDTIVVNVNAKPSLTGIATISACRTQINALMPSRTITPISLRGGVGTWTWNGSNQAINVQGANSSVIINNLENLPRDTFYTGMNTNSAAVTKLYYIKYAYQAPIHMGGCTVSDSVALRVLAAPKVSAGTDLTFCSNNAVYAFANHNQQPIDVTGNLGVWSISKGNGLVTTTQGANKVYTFNPKTTTQFLPDTNKLNYTYTVNYVLSSPNITLSCSNVAQTNVFVLAAPNGEAGTDKYYCLNSAPVNLRLAQKVGSGGYFKNQTGVIVNDTFVPLNAAVLPLTNKLYYQVDTSACSVIDSFVYRVNTLPTVNAGTDKTFCENAGTSSLATLQLPTPSGGVFYNAQNAAITNFDPLTALKLPNVNRLVYTYGQVNTGVTCYGYDTFNYSVSPIATLQSITGDTIVAKNSISSYTTQSNPQHSLVWNVTGGQLQSSNQNQATILWSDTGMANIKITASNPYCADVVINQQVHVQPTSGLSEMNLLQSFKMYPNPTSQTVTIELLSELGAEIEVYNATMQLVKTKQAISIGGQIHEHLSTQEMTNGVYFVRVTTGNQSGLFKLVVMK